MAKSDKKDLYNTSMNKVNQSEGEYNQLYDKVSGRGDTVWDRATEDYSGAYKGYSDYAAGGGLTDADKQRMQDSINALYGAGGGGGGGVSAPRLGTSAYRNLHSAYANAYRPDYNESDTGFRNLASATGGFNQEQLNKIYGNVDTLTGIGQTGGFTDEDKANIFRQSILNQEQTGGYTDQDKALIRAKSAASSPAYFSALKDNLERTRNQTGNLANASAVNFKLAREGAQQQNADRINSEIGLAESIRKGKETAGQFLSQQGKDVYGTRSARQIEGASQGGQLGLSTQQGITANQLQGLRGLQESQTALGNWGLGQAGGLDQFGLAQAGGLDQWDLAQAQMDMQAQAANAASSNARAYQAAAANAEYQKWLTEYGNEQKQYGITGLNDLYKTNLDSSQYYSGLSADVLNSKYGTQGNLLGIATQNRGNTAMENVAGIAGAVGTGLGVWTGTGGFTKPPTGTGYSGIQIPGSYPVNLKR